MVIERGGRLSEAEAGFGGLQAFEGGSQAARRAGVGFLDANDAPSG